MYFLIKKINELLLSVDNLFLVIIRQKFFSSLELRIALNAFTLFCKREINVVMLILQTEYFSLVSNHLFSNVGEQDALTISIFE